MAAIIGAGAEPWPDQMFVPAHGGLGQVASAVTGRALPAHAATLGHKPDMAVVTRHRRFLRGLSTEAVESFMATLAHIESQIGSMADGPTEPGPDFLPIRTAVAGAEPEVGLTRPSKAT